MVLGTVTAGLFAYYFARRYRKNREAKFLKNAPEPSIRDAKLVQILSMRVGQTYIRDGTSRNKSHKADPRVVHESQFWMPMENCGVSEEEQREVGLAHYLRKNNHPEPGVAPRLIIASRGTILSSCQDIVDDIRVGLQVLHKSRRYQKCEQLILKLVKHFRANYGGNDPSDIWVVGHSLGADIALAAGMKLAEKRIQVSLCCFNCPLLTLLSLTQTVFLIKSISNALWSVKDVLGDLSNSLGRITDRSLKSIDCIKLTLAYLSNREEVIRQLNQFKALQMGPVLMCVNKDDYICKEYFKFYRRNHEKGRIHLSLQALLSKFALDQDPMYFRVPQRVTMFLSNDSEPHSLKQWFSDAERKKIEFDLNGAVSN